MLIKFIVTVLILINLKPPFISLIDISLIFLLILLLVSSKSTLSIKTLIFQKNKIIFILILLTLVNFITSKNFIEEAHSVFINNKDLKIIDNFLPANVMVDVKRKFQKFDVNRMIKSDDIFTIDNYNELKKINSPYAFSADSFFQKNKFSRQVNKINFSSREELRIGHLNTLKYNLVHDKQFRRILPYYVLYEIPKIAKKSTICANGNVYYYFSNKIIDINEIQKINFTNLQKQECLELKNKFEKFYIVGFSINEKDTLSIQLQKNILLYLLDIFKYIIIILIIFLSFFLLKLKFSINSFIYFISIISTIILALIRDSNLIFGFRYFRGGADGLLHNSFAQDIIQNISNGNYLQAFMGGEDVFYNMPGLRYFGAFSKLFFGDTNYAYLLISSLLPLGIYIFFKHFLNKKYAIILFTSFVFVPIFENMGFGYFNYIWQVARNHAETLSITLIIFSLIFILDFSKNNNENNNEKLKIVLVGISLSLAAISRPNFFPTSVILSLYIFITYTQKKNYLNSILILSSFSTVSLCLLHNIFYGESFYFFTNSHMHNFVLNFNGYTDGLKNFFLGNFQNENLKIIFYQFSLWNPLYNIHRLIIIIIILYFLTIKKQNLLVYFLFASAISQHGVLLITMPSSRYAYLAWLLTFILFLKIEFDNKLIKSLYLKFISKSKYR